MMQRLQRISVLALGVAALAALTPATPAHAAGVDGGVTFTNVVPNGSGITYHRTASPRKAVRDAINAGPRIPITQFAAVRASTPQKERGAPGVALFDYDRDGDIDLYVTNGPGSANSLYQSQLAQTGQLTFVDVAAAAGVTLVNQDSTGVCFGDTDNDGDDDLYVVSVPSDYPDIQLDRNHFFRNNGNGTFTDITVGGPLAGIGRHASGCSMGDVNADGLLDIFVSNTYDDWKHRQPVMGLNIDLYPGLEPNELFINRGGNTFTEEAQARGLWTFANLASQGTYSWAPALVDYDLDGDVDVMHADTQGAMMRDGAGYNRLFENDGSGHFTDVSVLRGLTQAGSWMGLSYGDYNCDGYLDFFSTNLGRFVGGLSNNSAWFLGSASKSFTNPGVGPLVGTGIPFGWGTSTFDFDNDGDQDIVYFGDDDIFQFMANDNRGVLLRNTGSCTATFGWENVLQNSRNRQVHGVATGDLNNDGFDDIVSVAAFVLVPVPGRTLPWTVIAGGPTNTVFDAVARAELMMTAAGPDGQITNPVTFAQIPHTINDGDLAIEVNSANNGNAWAKVQLLGGAGIVSGSRVNRSGIGAVLRVTPEGGPTSLRPILGGASYASENALIQTLGLGSASKATVEVIWPGGIKNSFEVAAGETLVVPEIPCNFDQASWKNFGQFNSCVVRSLDQFRNAGQLSQGQRDRFWAGARRVFGQ
jgi:hypothetical protein